MSKESARMTRLAREIEKAIADADENVGHAWGDEWKLIPLSLLKRVITNLRQTKGGANHG